MKNLVFLLFCFFVLSGPSYAQAVDSSRGAELLEKIPQEKIFVHYNSSLLFSGEYMYYKLYNLNAETGNFSKTSKVAYIELLGEGGNSIFKHKILLKNGQGRGDFFIPTTVPSGNYKLLGYTNWMRNEGTFFAGDVAIINPYQGDQSAISTNSEGDSLDLKNNSGLKELNENINAPVKIIVENDLFGKREKVILKLEGASGNYSLSVRKKDSINIPETFTSEDFNQLFQNRKINKDSVFVPEMRGSLISGRIIPNTSNTNTKLAGNKLAFSIPGEDFIFKIATTNKEGKFYIDLDDPYDTSRALMQILGEGSENWIIKLDPLPKINDPNLEFGKFHITPGMKEWILDRSVQNQIENAYYSVKPDTLKALEKNEPFYTKEPTVYDLDAYTRFATIKETFVEIIRFAWISTNKDESMVVVRQPQGATNYNLPPLLLVDGTMVQDHDLFINYPAKYVKSINILRDNFFLGSHIFAGIIDVKTIEGNFDEILNQDYVKKVELKLPEPTKYYFKQTYGSQSSNLLSRIPDRRTQLFWAPSVELDSPTKKMNFYTSDIPGTFEVHLEGFTSEGQPVSVKEEITVEAGEIR